MPTPYHSAVVLGASMTGLLAARALSRHFESVAVVDQDVLPEGTGVRKGVPQSPHAHGLLCSGYRVMDEYFPGMMDDLEAMGAPRGDIVGDFLWFQYGRWKFRHQSGLRGITVSRPCLEAAIRQRVKKLPNVMFHEGARGVMPTLDRASGKVTGLIVQPRNNHDQKILRADLVIDASGKGSQSPQWLEKFGFLPPDEIVLKVRVGYATRTYQRWPGEFFNSNGGIISGTPPASTRYGAVLAAEGNRWMVTLVGTVGDYPPTKDEEWIKFAASLPVPAVHDLVTTAKPLTEIVTYRFPANQRRYYERMKRFPSQYLVMGDAVCSFNPIYGQGMSVAATEAKALDDSLEQGNDGLWPRFYARASKIVDIPWAIATGEDLRFPQVQGRRPRAFWFMNRYMERVHEFASKDPVVCRRFFQVLNLLAPPSSLMTPRMIWRMFTPFALRSKRSPT